MELSTSSSRKPESARQHIKRARSAVITKLLGIKSALKELNAAPDEIKIVEKTLTEAHELFRISMVSMPLRSVEETSNDSSDSESSNPDFSKLTI